MISAKSFILIFFVLCLAPQRSFAKINTNELNFFKTENNPIISNYSEDPKTRTATWTATIHLCWSGDNASFCSESDLPNPVAGAARQSFILHCAKHNSSLCPDPDCGTTVNREPVSRIRRAWILDNSNVADVLVLQGNSCGCMNCAYYLYVIGKDQKVWCSRKYDDKDPISCDQQIFSNPRKFIKLQQGTCTFDRKKCRPRKSSSNAIEILDFP